MKMTEQMTVVAVVVAVVACTLSRLMGGKYLSQHSNLWGVASTTRALEAAPAAATATNSSPRTRKYQPMNIVAEAMASVIAAAAVVVLRNRY